MGNTSTLNVLILRTGSKDGFIHGMLQCVMAYYDY